LRPRIERVPEICVIQLRVLLCRVGWLMQRTSPRNRLSKLIMESRPSGEQVGNCRYPLGTPLYAGRTMRDIVLFADDQVLGDAFQPTILRTRQGVEIPWSGCRSGPGVARGS